MNTPYAYPEDVWKALREYYESSPRHITWKPCCEHVGELLKTPVPDPSVVARKANKEGWRKRRLTSKQAPQSTGRQDVGNDQQPTSKKPDNAIVCEPKTTSDLRIIYEVVEGGRDDQTEALSKKSIKEGMAQVSRAARENDTTQKKVINKHRGIAAALAGMIELVIDTTTEAYNTIVNADDQDSFLRDDDGAFELEKKQIILKMEMVAGTADLVEKLSRAHERVAKIELAVWGITPDDMKEGQAAARLAVVEDGKAKLAEGAVKLAKQKAAMMARLNGMEQLSENLERPDPVLRQRDNTSSHDEVLNDESEHE